MMTSLIENFTNNLIAEDRYRIELMRGTPLTDAQRSALSAACRQVIEEPTKRGFRVKLII